MGSCCRFAPREDSPTVPIPVRDDRARRSREADAPTTPAERIVLASTLNRPALALTVPVWASTRR